MGVKAELQCMPTFTHTLHGKCKHLLYFPVTCNGMKYDREKHVTIRTKQEYETRIGKCYLNSDSCVCLATNKVRLRRI